VLIETPLLVVGRGPAALLVARMVSGVGRPCLLAGHEVLDSAEPAVLDEAAVATLEAHGLLDIFRPFFVASSPPAVVPAEFEEVLKGHCVADVNITVYDGLELVEAVRAGEALTGVLTDGRGRWDVQAEAFVDAADLPAELPAAVLAAAEAAATVLAAPR
jgi:hypothetical protein